MKGYWLIKAITAQNLGILIQFRGVFLTILRLFSIMMKVYLYLYVFYE